MIGATRCAKCRKLRPCDCVREQWHDRKTSERGYGSEWRKCRSSVLAERPLCQDCADRGETTPATEVHHIVKIRDDETRRLDPTNLMALCRSCHAARTARGE